MITAISSPIINNVNVSEIQERALANISNNLTLKDLPPELLGNITSLITIIKTIGIVVIIYLIFWVINSIVAMIQNRRIKKIYKNVNEINKKLDILLKKSKK
ncbi:MAG: hypothetical protein WC979_04490 [Candidatus Pacearchaeota archaeon]|jgi:hypothetical protein